MNDPELADQCRALGILTEGFPTYGGWPDATSRRSRRASPRRSTTTISATARARPHLGDGLLAAGPLVQPFGGHAIYVDARAFLPHITPLEYPGQALAVELYAAGGIRAARSAVMFGRRPDGPRSPLRWTSCASPSRAGRTPRAM